MASSFQRQGSSSRTHPSAQSPYPQGGSSTPTPTIVDAQSDAGASVGVNERRTGREGGSGSMEKSKPKNLDEVIFGDWIVETWYHSPYPKELVSATTGAPTASASGIPSRIRNGKRAMTPQHRSLTPPVSSKLASASPAPPDAQPPLRRLWVCDQCFAYNRDQKGYGAHRAACKLIRPPGEQIYSYGITVWKVSGQEQKLFCQNLSLFAKLFIDFKAITFDVSHFDFYVVCELENRKDQIVGFFSKEIRSHENYNLATYLVFPPWMGQKYGTLMMEMSYHLTRLGPPGTPERPLSALGEVAYATFWARTILRRLLEFAVWAVGDHTWRDKWLRIAAEGRPIAVQDFEQTPEMPVGQLRLTVDEVARLAHLQPDDVAVALTHLGFSSAQQPDVRLSFYSLLELCSTWKVYARTVMNPKGFKAK